jgi:hypothetical protein
MLRKHVNDEIEVTTATHTPESKPPGRWLHGWVKLDCVTLCALGKLATSVRKQTSSEWIAYSHDKIDYIAIGSVDHPGLESRLVVGPDLDVEYMRKSSRQSRCERDGYGGRREGEHCTAEIDKRERLKTRALIYSAYIASTTCYHFTLVSEYHICFP